MSLCIDNWSIIDNLPDSVKHLTAINLLFNLNNMRRGTKMVSK